MNNDRPPIYTGIRSRQKMLDILREEPNAIFLGSYGQEIPHEIIYGSEPANEDNEDSPGGDPDGKDEE